jgi:hypothetical protein
MRRTPHTAPGANRGELRIMRRVMDMIIYVPPHSVTIWLARFQHLRITLFETCRHFAGILDMLVGFGKAQTHGTNADMGSAHILPAADLIQGFLDAHGLRDQIFSAERIRSLSVIRQKSLQGSPCWYDPVIERAAENEAICQP